MQDSKLTAKPFYCHRQNLAEGTTAAISRNKHVKKANQQIIQMSDFVIKIHKQREAINQVVPDIKKFISALKSTVWFGGIPKVRGQLGNDHLSLRALYP